MTFQASLFVHCNVSRLRHESFIVRQDPFGGQSQLTYHCILCDAYITAGDNDLEIDLHCATQGHVHRIGLVQTLQNDPYRRDPPRRIISINNNDGGVDRGDVVDGRTMRDRLQCNLGTPRPLFEPREREREPVVSPFEQYQVDFNRILHQRLVQRRGRPDLIPNDVNNPQDGDRL